MMRLIGAVSGLISGFFASGGALAAVPALTASGLTPKTAQATAQSAMLCVTCVTVFVYFIRESVPVLTLAAAAGGALGGLLGARVRLNDNIRVIAFRLLSVWAGLRLLCG